MQTPVQTASPGIAWSHDQLVGFGPRFVAYLIDAILIGIVSALLNVVHLGFLGSLVSIAYLVYFWSTTGVTIGNRVMNIRVAKADGSALSWGTGIVRYIGLIVSIIPIFLGLLWVIWDPNKQGWHDKLANTVVVRNTQ
jgi:uncharacterized RDD family membrane protein YckC